MSVGADRRPRVVFDVNVYLDYIRQADGSLSLPASEDIPTESAAADTLAIAFDERVKLFASPHIFRNVDRVMREDAHTDSQRGRFLEFVADVCDTTGGAVVEPTVLDHAIGDHEDNHILSLARDPSVNADVIVSSDRHLLDIGPNWHGRLILHPRDFARHAARGTLSRALPAPAVAPPPPPPRRLTPADLHPELRDVEIDPLGLDDSSSSAPAVDDYQR